MNSVTRALVVEDNRLVRSVLARVCTWIGLDVEVAVDGAEALAALERASSAGIRAWLVSSCVRARAESSSVAAPSANI